MPVEDPNGRLLLGWILGFDHFLDEFPSVVDVLRTTIKT